MRERGGVGVRVQGLLWLRLQVLRGGVPEG
jgi:hypothetical protein